MPTGTLRSSAMPHNLVKPPIICNGVRRQHWEKRSGVTSGPLLRLFSFALPNRFDPLIT